MRRSTIRARTGGLRRDERGVSLLVTALVLAVLLGMAALAIDVGLLMAARTEAQRAADAAALAGAGSLWEVPGDEDRARTRAMLYGGRNLIRNDPTVIAEGDVDVDLSELKVTVRVHRTGERGNPIPTIFARVLNIDAVDVSADAAAKAEPAGQANCLLPVALADNWVNVDGDPGYDPGEGDVYVPCPDPGCTGYLFPRDFGTSLQLKPAQGNKVDDDADQGGWFDAGWWYLWQPGERGASELKDYVTGCPDPSRTFAVGEPITDKNGNTQSIVNEFERLIANDPGAAWDPGCGTFGCVDGSAFEVSPRIRTVVLFDPDTYVKVGAGSNFLVSNFVGVFVERVDTGPPGQRGVWVRLVPAPGVGDGPGGGGFLRRPVLVE